MNTPSQQIQMELFSEWVSLIGGYLSPDEVFDDETLAEWAEENGYVKQEDKQS